MPKQTTKLAARTKEPKKIPISFRPSYEHQFPSIYSNFAQVSHTGTEFCLDFCLIAAGISVDVENKMVVAPVAVRVLIPPGMVDGVINALKIEQDKFKTQDLETLTISNPQTAG